MAADGVVALGGVGPTGDAVRTTVVDVVTGVLVDDCGVLVDVETGVCVDVDAAVVVADGCVVFVAVTTPVAVPVGVGVSPLAVVVA